MARTPHLTIRVSPARKARWEAAAASEGVSLTEFIKEAIDARLDGRGTSAVADAGNAAELPATGERQGGQPRPSSPAGDLAVGFKGPRFK